MIKVTQRNVIEVQDWDKLVQDTYGKPYSFQQQDGCRGRGVVPLLVPDGAYDFDNEVPDVVNHGIMGVSFEKWLARDPSEWNGEGDGSGWRINLFWYRNFYPSLQMVANNLHMKGLLPAGEYLINIDW